MEPNVKPNSCAVPIVFAPKTKREVGHACEREGDGVSNEYRDPEKWPDFTLRLVRLHEEAMRIGLYATGHAIHDAVRKTGWEQAELVEKVQPKARP